MKKFEIEPVAAKFEVLARPLCLRILFAIRQKAMMVRELKDTLQVAQSTLSHHLKWLLVAGFVECESKQQRNYYSVNLEAMRDFFNSVTQSLVAEEPAAMQLNASA